MYRLLFRLVFVRIDPEFTHELGAGLMRALVALGILRARPRGRVVEVAGIAFENRLGLAAGFDKNAELVRAAYALGFGHVEIGTVTAQAQPGNPRPRLFRLPDQRALINRMGFNNHGAVAVAAELSKLRASPTALPVIGVNIGKSRSVELADAAADYAFSASQLACYADYLAVNVSSPNTPGLRDLQQVAALRPILEAVLEVSESKPVFLKIAPDLADQDVLDCVLLARELGLAGLILANTTISRDGIKHKNAAEAGGLSGSPLKARALELLRLVRPHAEGLALISVGGIETAAEAQERLDLGAELVQSYTGFVYGGPLWPRRVVASLRKAG
jgi:dihydroorotate dehydrogenase